MYHLTRGRAAPAALLLLALGGLAAPRPAHSQEPTGVAPAGPVEAAGFIVDTVLVRGNQRVSEAAIRATAGIAAGATLSAPDVQAVIQRLMTTGQFESVQVYARGAEAGRGALVLDVREQPLIAGVEFRGLKSVGAGTVRDSAKLVAGAPLDPQRVATAQKLVRDLLAKRGVQLLGVDTALVPVPGGEGYTLVFDVREGNRLSIAEIEFTGNEAFSDEALREALKTREEGFLWFRTGKFDREVFEADLRTRLPEFYGRRGYIDFAVVGDTLVVDPETGKARVVVDVREGQQYRLGDFAVVGNRRFPTEALASVFTTQRRSVLGLPFGGASEREAGEVFDRAALDAAVRDIAQMYRNEGYLFADVVPTVQRVAPAEQGAQPTVNVTLAVSEERPFYIRKIAFVGNTTTHESVIRDRLWIVPGDVYNEERVLQSYQSISGLGFFEAPLPPPDIQPDPETGTVDLVFHIKEKQTGSVNFGTVFGGGYNGSRGSVAGFLGYQQPNLFGQGKQAALRAEFGYGRSTLEASYTDPAIFGTRNSGSFSVFRTGDRYVRLGNGRRLRTGGSLSVGFPVPGALRTRAFLGYSLSRTEYQTTEDDACDPGSASVFCIRDATASSLSLSLTRDTKNHPLFPTAGARQSLSLEQTGGPLGGDGDFQKLFTNLEWWTPVATIGGGGGGRGIRTALGLQTRAGAIFGDVSRFPFEQFHVGGVMQGQPLRGYQEYTIGPRGYNLQCNNRLELDCLGDAFFTVSAEYAVRLTDGLSVSAFADAGNVFGSVGEFNTTQLFRGAGVGATVVTPFLGAIGIDAAYGFDRPDPGWEIHFKLGNAF